MFLNKLPVVQTPKPIIFGAAIFLAALYFWFTQPQSSEEAPRNTSSNPES